MNGHSTKVALRFIQPIDGLKIPESTGVGEVFGQLYYLTNDKACVLRLIEPDIVGAMGLHFRNTALNSGGFIYLEGDTSRTARESTELSVDYFVWESITFLLALWVVKDHAIELLPAILKISEQNKDPEYLIRTFGWNNFNATGGSTPTEFSREEIRIAGEYYQDWIIDLTRRSTADSTRNDSVFSKTNFESNSTRLLRFLCLLLRARNIPDIGIKLGLFCSCLECLFANEKEKQEVTHQIAEKIAFFLETTPQQRKDTFRLVKSAYTLRSSVLHGGTISNGKLQGLEQICIQTDDILRRVFVKILKSKSSKPDFYRLFTEDEKGLQEFLSDLIFSSGTPSN